LLDPSFQNAESRNFFLIFIPTKIKNMSIFGKKLFFYGYNQKNEYFDLVISTKNDKIVVYSRLVKYSMI
jgi:hypothetical protein